MGKRWKRKNKNKHTGEGKDRDDPKNKQNGGDGHHGNKEGNNNNKEGGYHNKEKDPYVLIAGGNFNVVASTDSGVFGGGSNTAQAEGAVVVGGKGKSSANIYSTTVG